MGGGGGVVGWPLEVCLYFNMALLHFLIDSILNIKINLILV